MKFVPLTEFRQSYFSILGQIAIAMGAVENQLNFLMIEMLEQNTKLASNLTFGYHLDKVIEMLRAVFYSKNHPEDVPIVFEYLITELKRLHSERNKNLHCLWNFDDKTKTANRFKIGKHKQGNLHAPDWRNVPLEELQQLNSELWAFVDELKIFATAYYKNPLVHIPAEDEAFIKASILRQLNNARDDFNKRK